MRLDALEEVHGDADVLLAERLLANAPGFVEREVEEMDAVGPDARVPGAGAGLGAPDEALIFWSSAVSTWPGFLAGRKFCMLPEALDDLASSKRS
jgi:hypothetical protein